MKHSIHTLADMTDPITWITAYDYPMAICCEKAGIDMILVGDSGGMVQLGYESTIPVTMDEMITMCKAVRRGAPKTFIVGDMPLGSYEASNEQAVKNAVKFIKAGCDAVKLEGGHRIVGRLNAINKAGIIPIGHVGLTPQSKAALGGYKVQGKDVDQILDLIATINTFEDYDIKMVLFEAITNNAMKEIRDKTSRSMIHMGIGAGENVDGQLLILHDILGFYVKFKPRFAKVFLDKRDGTLIDIVTSAIKAYIKEVKEKIFPTQEYWY